MNYSEQYKVPDLPEGKSGTWEIKRFEVKKEDLVRQLFSMANSGRYVPEGAYTGLFRKDDDDRYTIVMSDTPDEINDHLQPIIKAEGDVLIAGLGLGVVLNALAKKKEVNHITIVELSTDVLTLVKKHYEVKYPGKITFIQADILTWKLPQDIHWNYAWFDIWDNLSIDNLPEMAKLHRKFTRFVDAYGSWGQKYLQSRQKQEHRERERWRS